MNEKKANNGTSKRRKALSATLAIAMILVMLLSGTLAYFYQAKAINLMTGASYKKVIGHDDFDDRGYTTANAAGQYIANKDVYVENVGNTLVWVRVKLEEGLEKDGKVIQSLNSPTIHKMNNTDATDTTPENGLGSDMIDGISHQETFHAADNGFKWTMGGDPTEVLSAQDDQISTLTDQTKGIYIDTSNGAEVAHDDYGEGKKMGSAKKMDTPASTVISMAAYMEKPQYHDDTNPTEEAQTEYVGWVSDENGWYYWSKMLKPGDVTGLLLDQVEVIGDLATKSEYKYNIHVTFEAVDETDRNLWNPVKIEQTVKDEYQNEVKTDQATEKAWILMDNAYYMTTNHKTGAAAAEESRDQMLEKGQYGAAKAYDMAAKKLKGDASYKTFYPNADELLDIAKRLESAENHNVVAVFDEASISSSSANQIAGATIDAALARALTAQYGSKKWVNSSNEIVAADPNPTTDKEKWVLTADEMMAVSTLMLNSANYGTVQDYSSLTKDTCPYISGLYFNNSQAFAESTEMDGTGIKQLDTFLPKENAKSILPQIKNLQFGKILKKGNVNLTEIDLKQFTHLEYLSLSDSTAFNTVIVPTTLTALHTTGASVKTLKTNTNAHGEEKDNACNVMNLQDLEFIGTGPSFTNYQGFGQLKKLRYVELGTGGTTIAENDEFDFSGCTHLKCLSFNVGLKEHCVVKVSSQAFRATDSALMSDLTINLNTSGDYPLGVLNFGNNMNLVRVDVSEFSASFNGLWLNSNMSALKTVVRRQDQHEFAKYPDHVVYEKVVDAQGNAVAYYKHEGETKTLESSPANFNNANIESTTDALNEGKVFPFTTD